MPRVVVQYYVSPSMEEIRSEQILLGALAPSKICGALLGGMEEILRGVWRKDLGFAVVFRGIMKRDR